MRTTVLSLAVFALWGAGWAMAQEPPVTPGFPEPPPFQIPPGARVRLASRALPGGVVEGRVTSSTDEALGLAIASGDSPFGTSILIPRTSLTSLQVSMGYRRYTLPGALFGAIAGAAGGAAAEVDPSSCDSYSSNTFCSRGEAVAILAATGAVLGGVVGYLIKTERWQKVSVEVLAPRSSGGRAAPAGHRVAVAARVTIHF